MAGKNPQVRKPAGSPVGTDLVKDQGSRELAAMRLRALSYSHCRLEHRHPFGMLDGKTPHRLIRWGEQSELIHQIDCITSGVQSRAVWCFIFWGRRCRARHQATHEPDIPTHRSAGLRQQLRQAFVRFGHPALHARTEHPVALLGRVEQRGSRQLRAPAARSSNVTVSTITCPGRPSHSNVCTMRSGRATSR